MTVLRLLAASSVAMVLTHWLRILPLGYAAPGATRYEDFVDLLTPFVVLAPLLAVLAVRDAGTRTWAAALLGGALFFQGHGLHLSANSISYASGDRAPAYLWDEVVGHHLWFVGLTVVAVAVCSTLDDLVLPVSAWVGAVLVGATWAVNVVEGGSVPVGSALAAGLTVYGARRGTAAGRLLAATFALSLVLVAAYGAWRGGFPQPSELGWL